MSANLNYNMDMICNRKCLAMYSLHRCMQQYIATSLPAVLTGPGDVGDPGSGVSGSEV